LKRRHIAAAAFLLVCAARSAIAQSSDDTRTQYPRLLQNSYISINVGAIDQPFSQAQLEPGFHAASIEVPRVDVRVMLIGHEFNRFVSAQASYMRPLNYVTYANVRSGDVERHHVRVNFGAVTVKARLPVARRWSAYGESGLGFTSRTGFNLGDTTVVTDAHYASLLLGGGAEYRLTPSWDVTGGVTFSPGRDAVRQPHTVFFSSGFRYTVRPLPADRVDANRDAGVIFPRHLVQVEYSSGTGYGVNDFVSRKVPIFWGGHAKVDFGIAPHYERNVFHTRKVFALDVGGSAGF
jgi:opacity protein-like surface antigen